MSDTDYINCICGMSWLKVFEDCYPEVLEQMHLKEHQAYLANRQAMLMNLFFGTKISGNQE